MKRCWVLLIIGILYIGCFGQTVQETIHVNQDIDLIRISENAYVHVSRYDMPGYGVVSSNGLILLGENKEAFLFDTPMTDSLTKDLVVWLEDNWDVNITGFVPNHWHDDCLGGLNYLQTIGVKSFANQMTIEIAKTNKLPVPDYGFKDSLELKLGDKTIDCYYLGAAHSMDNIIVWIPSEQILFAGCMLKSLDSPNLGNTADGDLNAYPSTLAKLKAKFPAAKVVIPGHGQFGGIGLIEHTIGLSRQ
jgi:metallo-beta-lactamase class B